VALAKSVTAVGDCQRRGGLGFNLNPHQRSIENYGMDKSENGVVTRRFACMVLGELGSNAKSAVPALTEALNDSDEWVRKRANEALTNINATVSTDGVGKAAN
jgi:hypothetical protein